MSTISDTVMRRVRVIHTLRPLLSHTALGSALVLLAAWGIGREVWVAHVIQNMPALTDVAALEHFVVSAFLNTRFIVQLLTLGAAAALVYTFTDFVRALQTQRSFV